LQRQIKDGRANDVQANTRLVDQISRRDGDFDRLDKELAQQAIPELRQRLAQFNSDCDKHNASTQKSEVILKEKEVERQKV